MNNSWLCRVLEEIWEEITGVFSFLIYSEWFGWEIGSEIRGS